MSHHDHSPAWMHGSDLIDGRAHARDHVGRRLGEVESPIHYLEGHLGESGIDPRVLVYVLRGFNRAPRRTRMNRSHRPTLHTLSQPCSLLTTGRAQPWIRLILAVLIRISVADEPDLGRALDADQEGRLEIPQRLEHSTRAGLHRG